MTTIGTNPTQGLLASITEKRVLSHLSESSDGLSRSEIAHLSGISKPAVSDAARRLEESGIIIQTGTRGGKRGGVATVFAINGARGHSVSLALDSESATVRSRKLDGEINGEISRRLPRDADREAVVSTAKSLLASIEASTSSPLLATTVSVAGPVDSRTGEIIALADSVFPAGHIHPLIDLNLDPLRSAVDNDVNWATLAERHLGTMRNVDDFVYVYLGAGLGAGLYVGGALQRGARGLAGEIGQLRSPDGQDLTRRLAGLGFGRTGPASYGLDIDIARDILTASPLTATAEAALFTLTITIANIVTLLNSSAVILGGPLATFPVVVEYLADSIPRQSLDQVSVGQGTCTPLDGASYAAHRRARQVLGF